MESKLIKSLADGHEIKNEKPITQKDFETAKGISLFSLEPQSNRVFTEGEIIQSGVELRRHVFPLTPKTMEVGQGQVCVEINDVCCTGSGVVCHSLKLGGCFLLTCAHNFISIATKGLRKGNVFYSTRASYQYCKTEHGVYAQESPIKKFYEFPGYLENPDIELGFDLAIGLFEKDLKAQIIWDSQLSTVDKRSPQKGETIKVIGYPAEKGGQLYEMVGTIKDIIDIAKNKVIIYDDINTTPGQSGSPVYLKRDERWFLIGIHVGYDPYANVNIATAITAEVEKWIVETLTQVASEKI